MRKKKGTTRTAVRRARATHGRQRQRLIDACISALHIHGPSQTTVEKVVAIADMSPGIVRFYFDSKAAMLVASLQYLSAEFEERVLVPVGAMKSTPVAALERLVDLYLDPEIASARKVSVWYSFWGEASSRQEYYDICGTKDERFAALVRELIERLIEQSGQTQLDPDGIALGLIGVLEMLWQGFAFLSETAIDRAAARHRCMAYLRSVFPGRFPPGRGVADAATAAAPTRSLPAWSYANAALLRTERRDLFRDAWQLVADVSRFGVPGAHVAADLGAERALVVRDAQGTLRAYRNSCPVEPHALVANGRGVLADERIECRLHGLAFRADGQEIGGGPPLHALELSIGAGLVFVRAGSEGAGPGPAPAWAWLGEFDPIPIAPPAETIVGANWKLVVEHALSLAMPEALAPGDAEAWYDVECTTPDAADRILWRARPSATRRRWSLDRYRSILGDRAGDPWRRVFVAPNQLFEVRPDGLLCVQILPIEPGSSRVRRLRFSTLAADARGSVADRLAARIATGLRQDALDAIESAQRGRVEYGYGVDGTPRPGAAAARFREWLRGRIPALAHDAPPGGGQGLV
ncbi:MAG: TetR family transcriptional regulator C-terminal domain-containing protein [Gammaproteobacteria bacterium]|nr:TetR family transcriptional regulator C-terminal domain-containing protein [Gammaproteobacteria bacterium]